MPRKKPGPDKIDNSIEGKKEIRLVLFTGDLWEHVCPTLRIIHPSVEAGIEVLKGTDWSEGSLHIFPELVSEADIVVIQRDFPVNKTEYSVVIDHATTHGKPVVFEMDDLLIDLSKVHPDLLRYKKARFPILQAILQADAVTSASAQLRDYLRQFNQNSWLLPNYLNDSLWKIRPISEDEGQDVHPTVIGYMGGDSHIPDLEMVEPVLLELLERHPHSLEIRFWGIEPGERLKNNSRVSWEEPELVNYSDFVDYFLKKNCDIFIAPLEENDFNKSKSSLKFLEYSALGIPGVYSRIAPYEQIVIHGENGFLAESISEWDEYISKLIDQPSLRREMGKNAQDIVKRDWMLSDHKEEWSDLYRSVISKPKKRILQSGMISTIWQINDWYQPLEEQLRDKELEIQNYRKHQKYIEGIIEELKLELSKREMKVKKLSNEITEQNETIHELQVQDEKNIQEIGILRKDLKRKEREVRRSGAELSSITRSTAYQLMKIVWKLRNWIAPNGSRRQRLLDTLIRGGHFLSTQGVRMFIRRVLEKARLKIPARRAQPSSSESVSADQITLQFSAEPGTTSPSPVISIIVLDSIIQNELLHKVTKWVNDQTLKPVEIISWSKNSGHAYALDNAGKSWEITKLSELLENVHGRYIAVASHDLLRMDSTYLETNLIALETETLLLTINFLGNDNGGVFNLTKGFSPGDSSNPLLRQVVRKDVLKDGFQINFSPFLNESAPVVLGKVIIHTKPSIESDSDIPFHMHFEGAELTASGLHLVGRKRSDKPWGSVPFMTSPVDTVVQIEEEHSDKPTVLLVMPFLAIGGAERVALDMVRELHHEIRFIIVTFENYDPSLGTTVEAFRELTPYIYTTHDFLLSHLNYSFFIHLIRRFSPTTLYIANGGAWIYDALSSIKAEFPDLRFANQVYDHKAGWINRYDVALVSGIEAHIGVNRKICRAFLERGVHTDCVYLIENGVNTDEYDFANYSSEQLATIKQKLGVPLDRRVITQIGRMHPQKRPMDFVELARRYKDDESLFFLLVGDGSLTDILDKEIKRIQLGNILHHPFYQPSNDIYAISDVIVMPSEYEGMPMVILEAQAMGTPVLVTDVGNNREVLEKTKGGIVLDQIGNPGALAAGLQEVIERSFNPRDIRESVVENYSLRRMADAYREALLEGQGM